jgi:hypothetical protein
VLIWLSAKRTLAASRLVPSETLIESALDIFTTCSTIACASARERSAPAGIGVPKTLGGAHWVLPVLITLTWRKRAGGEPWLTALT